MGSGHDRGLSHLSRLIERAGLEPHPATVLLSSLLDIAPTPDEAELPEGVELRRELTLQALSELLVAPARRAPLLLVIEDLQWADPTTLGLIGSLAAPATAHQRIMVVGTARSELDNPWSERADVAARQLDRLDHRSTREMVNWITRGHTLGADLVATTVERSEGVPLFVEELARLISSDDGRDAGTFPGSVPGTLRDLLVGRIDRLGVAKGLLQAAAVIGREFSLALLATLQGEDSRAVARALTDPGPSDLVSELEGTDEPVFAFRHVLLRDAAYSTLLLQQRRALHTQVARALTADVHGLPVLGSTAGVIAHHYAEGGLAPEAVEHFQAAANLSIAAGANAEALRLVDQAMALLGRLPAGPARTTGELSLLAVRGPALMAQSGYAHPSVAEAFERARDLCAELGDPAEIVPALYGLAAYSSVRSDLGTARTLIERLLRAAESAGDPATAVLAHAAAAQTLFIGGEFRGAATHADLCIAAHDPTSQGEHRIALGEDPGIICRGLRSWLLWLLGRPDEADAAIRGAIDAARPWATSSPWQRPCWSPPGSTTTRATSSGCER